MPTMIDRDDDRLIEVPRGLNNVVVAETRIGDVRGREGVFHYRGIPGPALAAGGRFVDAWHLIALGALPGSDADGAAFRERIGTARLLPSALQSRLADLSRLDAELDPVAELRTALALVSAADGRRTLYDEEPAERVDDAIRLAAVAPVLVTGLHRLRTGQTPLPPDPALDPVQDMLRMLHGREIDPSLAHALSVYLTAAIEHGFNASTFATRVVASTGADLAACVGAGLGALSGPLHGGAPSRVLDMLDEIGVPGHADRWVRDQVAAGRRIMGFGHGVYRTEDPRSRLLREVAGELHRAGLAGDRVPLAFEVEDTVLRLLDELKPGRTLRTNVELYAAVVMEACGIPRALFTAFFACARIIGWGAHAVEQAADGKILRPASRYVGALSQ